jgi:hypothetical protein
MYRSFIFFMLISSAAASQEKMLDNKTAQVGEPINLKIIVNNKNSSIKKCRIGIIFPNGQKEYRVVSEPDFSTFIDFTPQFSGVSVVRWAGEGEVNFENSPSTVLGNLFKNLNEVLQVKPAGSVVSACPSEGSISITAKEAAFTNIKSDPQFANQNEKDIEKKVWGQVVLADSKESFEAYLEGYPKGQFSNLAKEKLIQLNIEKNKINTSSETTLRTKQEVNAQLIDCLQKALSKEMQSACTKNAYQTIAGGMIPQSTINTGMREIEGNKELNLKAENFAKRILNIRCEFINKEKIDVAIQEPVEKTESCLNGRVPGTNRVCVDGAWVRKLEEDKKFKERNNPDLYKEKERAVRMEYLELLELYNVQAGVSKEIARNDIRIARSKYLAATSSYYIGDKIKPADASMCRDPK